MEARLSILRRIASIGTMDNVLVLGLVVALWFGSAEASPFEFAGASAAQAKASDVFGSAGDVVDPSPGGSANFVVESYARDYSVSYGEALRRLGRIRVLQAVMASIRGVEGARVAGWGIEHGSDFGAWIWLAGDEPPSDEAVRVAASHVDVEVRVGASYSLEELRSAERRLVTGSLEDLVGSGASLKVAFTAIDLDANGIEVGVDLVELPGRARRSADAVGKELSDAVFETELDRLSAVLGDVVGVPVVVSDARGFGPTARILGGGRLTACTTGFTAKLVGGDYGILTAGHCSNSDKYRRNYLPFGVDVSLPYVKGWSGKRADAQFHRVPAGSSNLLSDDYKCGKNAEEVCDVTGVKDRSDMLGDYVCHTGRVSGVSCGEITNNKVRHTRCYTAQRSKPVAKKVVCDRVFVSWSGPTLKVCGGDSGSPVYNYEGVAYGMLRGSNRGPNASRCSTGGQLELNFSVIREIEAFLGVEVLTEDPSPPSAPQGVEVDVAEMVRLSWAPPPEGAVEYRVFRRNRSIGESFALAGSTSTASYDHPVAELVPGMEYEYRVKAINNLDMLGPDSEVATVSIPAAAHLEAQPGTDGVSVSWSKPSGDVGGYEVYRRAAVAGQAYRKIGEVSSASFVDPLSGLTPGVEYYYRVKAVSSAGVVGGWGPGPNYARAVIPNAG